MAFSWRSIMRTLFDGDDESIKSVSPVPSDGNGPSRRPRTPVPSEGPSASRRPRTPVLASSSVFRPRTPPSSKSSTGYDSSDWLRSPAGSASSSNADDFRSVEENNEPIYSPKTFDGEYNVCFQRKPLGLGLVPSTQMYGAWEVSSVNIKPAVTHSKTILEYDEQKSTEFEEPPDDSEERRKISRGDVIVAVNFSTKKAQLSRDDLGMYLAQSSCPIVVTLRKPEVYGSFDSRSVATAMFPTSTEYVGLVPEKSFHSRASSSQWKRVLQYELDTVKKTKKKTNGNGKEYIEPTGSAGSSSPSTPVNQKAKAAPSPVARARASPTSGRHGEMHPPVSIQVRHVASPLTPQGEYSYVFTDTPLHLGLAPSTRLYGSLEVYDPGDHEPSIQIGDVVMCVNGDSAISQLPNDEALEFIRRVTSPVTIMFRRPAAYRQYLATRFHQQKIRVASGSVATSMFPDSAEYKQLKSHAASKRMQRRRGSERPIKLSLSTASLSEMDLGAMKKKEWEDASRQIAASGQFKLWRNRSLHVRPGAVSAFLTERHVQFLYKNLPINLACNKMMLAYDTRHNGWNTLSFFNALENMGPNLLIIRDSCDNIFGAFSSCSWKNSQEMYGNGRCFVFTLRPHARVYRWSGLDNTFMFCRHNSLFMGGGKRGTALCIQIDEMRGFSHACDTFDSPSLAPGNESFEMENLEVWCFSGLRI